MSSMPTLLSFGEILWDQFPTGDLLGGAPANLAYFLCNLGERAVLFSQVGRDPLGEKALQELSKLALPALVPQIEQETGRVQISFDQEGEPHYQFNTPNAWDFLSFDPQHFQQTFNQPIESLEMIAFGTLAVRSDHSLKTLLNLLEKSPKAQRFLDLNLRPPFYDKERLLLLLKKADILKINEYELTLLKRYFKIEALSTRDALFTILIEAHLSMILLTLGADGSIVMTPSDYSALSSISLPKEKMGDSVGAGDAFSAGFIAALRQGAHLREAHQFANQFASFICTQNGAFVEIPPHFREKLQHYSPW